MAISNPRYSSSIAVQRPECLDLGSCTEACADVDLAEIPDEIDLLQVLWAQIRSYRGQFVSMRSLGH